MKQKEFCLNLVGIIAVFASFRAGVSLFAWYPVGWYLDAEVVRPGTAAYNVLQAAAMWAAWFAVRRIPTA